MELYLSRIQLNPYSNLVRKDVGSPRDLHRTISGCFPAIDNPDPKPQHEKATPRNAYNVLHRLDRTDDGFVLYVQSAVEPRWANLRDGYAADVAIKPVHDLYANITSGDVLRFRLHANPSKRVGKGDEGDSRFRDEKKRRRVDIRNEEDRVAWLERKGAENGFRLRRTETRADVPAVETSMARSMAFRHDAARATIGSAVFNGTLEVTDAEAFRNALANGIGQGKAYGFGLLSVAPVR